MTRAIQIGTAILAASPVVTAQPNLCPSPTPTHHILFRDTGGNYLNVIAGWDHCAFVAPGSEVWESHPGYNYPGAIFQGIPPNTAWDPCMNQRRLVPLESGVQFWHSPGSFAHNRDRTSGSETVRYEAIEIPAAVASAMDANAMLVAGAGYPAISSLANPFNLLPAAQKGANGTFTCCGFVEYCSEGIPSLNNGEGFIPNCLETLSVFVPILPPPHVLAGAAISPQMIYVAIRDQWRPCDATRRILRGLIDPVDFVLTDPLGRRVGFTSATGLLNEIPGMEYSGNNDHEELAWSDALPGTYHVRLIGLGGDVKVIIGDGTGAGFGFEGSLAIGQVVDGSFVLGTVCYANCDGSSVQPVLTANDFQCFINKYASNDPYANCDGSTVEPVLTANDFQCFINNYAGGCS